MPADRPILEAAARADWSAWLAGAGASSSGVWLRIARKDGGGRSVSYADALDVALCHGWIDGQKDRLDERHWLQRFTPRTPRSRWSKRNRARAEELIAQGEMTPAGLREVERARADGRWEAAYDSHATATVPDDLQAALDRDPQAREFFATLDSRNRYAILYRVQEPRRPETRARRIEQFVAMLREGRTIHP
ncbi:MAG TPA: YdeI/OmpD-associated family protein [Gaiellales bacterium]